MRFLKLKEVMEKTALSRSAIYGKMNEGHLLQSISLGDRAVAWVESEVDEWMEGVLEVRDLNSLSLRCGKHLSIFTRPCNNCLYVINILSCDDNKWHIIVLG
ncbi:transcriptional regulator [Vibrio campbellii]|nr:transcriptional regulator [Vibrio campbellii]